MLRKLLAVALLFGLTGSAMAVVVPVELPFLPASGSINKLTLTIASSVGSDTKTTPVKTGSDMHLSINYNFDPATRTPTSVSYLDFTGGSVDFNDVTFQLSIFATIHATNIGGTFQTPTPHGSITASTGAAPNVTTFPTAQHNVVLNRGTLTIDPLIGDTTYYYLNTDPIVGTSVGTGTLTTTLLSVVNRVATYKANVNLPISFTQDVSGGGITATVTGTGTFVTEGTFTVGNLAPQANNDPQAGNESYYRGNEDNPITVALAQGVLANDVDYDPLTAVKITNPLHGTVALNSDGTFTYTPAANYNGADSFTYKAYDGELYSSAATVNLNVVSVNDPPVALDDSYTCDPDVVKIVYSNSGVLTNDTDVENSSLTAVKQSDPLHGTLAFLGGGGFTYTPAAGFHGTDSFTYKAFDGTDYSNLATVLLNVLGASIPGDANGDGKVNAADATIVAQHWGQSASGASQGDFNGDGAVNAADSSIMAANWGYGDGEAGAVPEPGMVALFAGVLAGLATRRRRK